MDQNFILKLPPNLAKRVEQAIDRQNADQIKIFRMNDSFVKFVFDGTEYDAVYYDLPNVVEAHKSLDMRQFYKSTDISNCLYVFDNPKPFRPIKKPETKKPKRVTFSEKIHESILEGTQCEPSDSSQDFSIYKKTDSNSSGSVSNSVYSEATSPQNASKKDSNRNNQYSSSNRSAKQSSPIKSDRKPVTVHSNRSNIKKPTKVGSKQRKSYSIFTKPLYPVDFPTKFQITINYVDFCALNLDKNYTPENKADDRTRDTNNNMILKEELESYYTVRIKLDDIGVFTDSVIEPSKDTSFSNPLNIQGGFIDVIESENDSQNTFPSRKMCFVSVNEPKKEIPDVFIEPSTDLKNSIAPSDRSDIIKSQNIDMGKNCLDYGSVKNQPFSHPSKTELYGSSNQNDSEKSAIRSEDQLPIDNFSIFPLKDPDFSKPDENKDLTTTRNSVEDLSKGIDQLSINNISFNESLNCKNPEEHTSSSRSNLDDYVSRDGSFQELLSTKLDGRSMITRSQPTDSYYDLTNDEIVRSEMQILEHELPNLDYASIKYSLEQSGLSDCFKYSKLTYFSNNKVVSDLDSVNGIVHDLLRKERCSDFTEVVFLDDLNKDYKISFDCDIDLKVSEIQSKLNDLCNRISEKKSQLSSAPNPIVQKRFQESLNVLMADYDSLMGELKKADQCK